MEATSLDTSVQLFHKTTGASQRNNRKGIRIINYRRFEEYYVESPT